MAQSFFRAATVSALMVVSRGRRNEAVLANVGRYCSNLRVGVGPRIPYQPLDWPVLDAFCPSLRKQISPSLIGLEESFGGCAWRWPIEASIDIINAWRRFVNLHFGTAVFWRYRFIL